MKFDLSKKLDLGYLGEEWKESYIEFYMPSYADVKDFQDIDENKAIDLAIDKLSGLFKGGKALSDGKLVDVTKDDIKDLPVEIITKAMQLISGQTDPKGTGDSTTA